MPFKVGDNVTNGDGTNYRVIAVQGKTYTLKNAWGTTTTKSEDELTAATGFSAQLTAYGPDLVELLTNSVVFGAQNLVLKKGFMNKENIQFLVEDALYEFLLKGYAQPYEEMLISRDPLSAEDAAAFFATQDVMDAIGKTLTIGLVDIIYRVLMKSGWKSAIWYDLRVATAIFIGNIVQRKLLKSEGGSYRPQ